MSPRPAQWNTMNARRFEHESVVNRYHLRLPYPASMFLKLAELAGGDHGRVLDIGTGLGELARGVSPFVRSVTAIDSSAAMVHRARAIDRDHSEIEWRVTRAEAFPTDRRFDLIMAGDSLHWMDWDVLLPRLAEMLPSNGVFAIVHRADGSSPWQKEINEAIRSFSSIQNFESGFDLIAELERRELFSRLGSYTSEDHHVRQTVDDYVESFHSRSSLSRAIMSDTNAAEFDKEVRSAVAPYAVDTWLDLTTVGSIEWGVPRANARQTVTETSE